MELKFEECYDENELWHIILYLSYRITTFPGFGIYCNKKNDKERKS